MPLIVTPESNLQPGKPHVSCSYHSYDFIASYCEAPHDVYMIITDGKITQTSIIVWNNNIVLGDLVAQWGKPVSNSRPEYGTVYVYWHDKLAYVFTEDRLSPNDRVGFIGYALKTEYVEQWQGFRNSP